MTKTVEKPSKRPPTQHEGKFQWWDEEVVKKKYKFTYLQQPGSDISFTKGRTVIKANGRTGTVHENFTFQDGEEYEMYEDLAAHLNKLTYLDGGHAKPRCMVMPVY
jgi:hypothetical protein